MVLFLWGRFRYDLTAIIALLAALALGVVNPVDAFKGFADDVVIIVGSALVISAAVQRSGIIEIAIRFLAGRVTSIRSQLLVLTASVGVSSALVKNVGALAMLMPAALQMAKKNKASPSVFLMPMSFASLLGGLMTLVGTSPDIIVSRLREEMTGGGDLALTQNHEPDKERFADLIAAFRGDRKDLKLATALDVLAREGKPARKSLW